MTGPREPSGIARAAVALAVRPLPDLDDRLRYRAEFTADLSVLGRLARLRYAAGVLSQTYALRAALGSAPTSAEEAAMTVTTRKVPFWRCRVFRLHDWVTRTTEDGERYRVCRNCGRDKSGSPGHTSAGLAGLGGNSGFPGAAL
jgi:hypothetical protein